MTLALVTGASRGIGRAVAIDLAAAGYDVLVNCHSRVEAAEQVASELRALGRQAHVVPFDVAGGAATESAVGELMQRYGVPDALVLNAGMTRDALFAMMGRDSWERVIATNLGGFYSVAKPVVRRMMRRRSGRIVAVTSLSGQRGNPGQANYAASKAGLIGAVKSLALEVASRGVTVNAVAPGLVETDMVAELPRDKLVPHIPLGRFGTPEEVAAAVTFLCSDRASYITGEVLSVNGGLYT